jgi:type IV secretion system protein VirB10
VPPAPLPPRGQEGTRLDDDPLLRRLPPIVPDQAEKRAFLRTAGSEATALKGRLQSPRSPYEIKAGTIIPSVLLTGINSDLPGNLLAQVREHVYDTVSGQYLLLPQGSKLVGTYDSAVIYGQDRVLVVWSRVILPNGDALSLENMPGVDLAGYAGFRDTVNQHWGRLLGAVVLSSVLNIGTRIPAGDVAAGRFFPTLGQEAAQDAGQGLGRAGQQVVQRQLQIQPTITIRPGLAINVFVHRDMTLRPYQAPAAVSQRQEEVR